MELVEERVLLATFTVTSNLDNGDDIRPLPGSLREAILNANSPNSPGLDLINFNISNTTDGVVQTITPLSPLPPITDPVIIDGTTQPGFSGTPIIELDGTSAGTGANGLTINTGGSTVQGLVINRFFGGGGIVLSSSGNILRGNFIGTDATGEVPDLGNLVGINLLSNANTMGERRAKHVISFPEIDCTGSSFKAQPTREIKFREISLERTHPAIESWGTVWRDYF
ncbi:MAG TPA: hypothetical protein VF590_11480 [Isosphaeraceae bacterium]